MRNLEIAGEVIEITPELIREACARRAMDITGRPDAKEPGLLMLAQRMAAIAEFDMVSRQGASEVFHLPHKADSELDKFYDITFLRAAIIAMLERIPAGAVRLPDDLPIQLVRVDRERALWLLESHAEPPPEHEWKDMPVKALGFPILGVILDGGCNIVDGWHRISKFAATPPGPGVPDALRLCAVKGEFAEPFTLPRECTSFFVPSVDTSGIK